jgi:hypothetical protein
MLLLLLLLLWRSWTITTAAAAAATTSSKVVHTLMEVGAVVAFEAPAHQEMLTRLAPKSRISRLDCRLRLFVLLLLLLLLH